MIRIQLSMTSFLVAPTSGPRDAGGSSLEVYRLLDEISDIKIFDEKLWLFAMVKSSLLQW